MFGKFRQLSMSNLYGATYNFICGAHPNYRPWHFQWHFTKDTHKWQKNKMSLLTGEILDVGCGNKPYQSWLNHHQVTGYKGLDVIVCEGVDIVVTPDKDWEITDDKVDGVILTQSLEHLENIEHTLSEVKRVLKPNGYILITSPFLYPEHGTPYDFRRFTTFGLKKLLEHNYEIIELTKCGNIGSVIATLVLTAIENNMNYNLVTRLLKGILLPLWIPFSFVINIICEIINHLDVSNTHYCNVCLWAQKKSN